MDEIIHLPDNITNFETLKYVLDKQGYVITKQGSENPPAGIGRLAKGKSLYDIANMHGLSAEYMRPELERGIEHEYEHTTERSVAEAIALDHLFENPKYYTMLDKMDEWFKQQKRTKLNEVFGNPPYSNANG